MYIHAVANGKISFFSWLSNVPFVCMYVCMCVHVCVMFHCMYVCVCIYVWVCVYCSCMCVCVHTLHCMYVCMCMCVLFHCMYMCIYVWVCTYITLHARVYVYICMGVCVLFHCVCVCVCVCVLNTACMCVCAYMCWYVCTVPLSVCIYVCVYTSSSSTHLLMGTWVVSISCQLQIMLQWTLLWFSHPLVSNSLWPMDCSNETSLSLTLSWSLPKFMSIVSVMPSSHLILWHSLLFLPPIFPSIRDFPVSWLFPSDEQNTGASASASVLPRSIQGWFTLRLTSLISLLSKECSGVFSSTTVGRHQFFGALPSLRFSSHKHVTNGNIRVHMSFQVSVFFFFR